jgi:hypothetical protein
MAKMSGYLTDLDVAARKSGLTVKTVSGWKTRGHGKFVGVKTVVPHHTAGPRTGNMPSLNVVTHGRAGLAGPLCNIALGRDGTVYIVAAGVAYHAGATGSSNWNNWRAIGIEAEATGVDKWTKQQYDAYAKLCAALIQHYGLSVSDVRAHKEIAVPKGRKIDPNFDMTAFRARVRYFAGELFAERKEPTLNNVQQARVEYQTAFAHAHRGLALLAKTPVGRKVVKAQARVIQGALITAEQAFRVLPKS